MKFNVLSVDTLHADALIRSAHATVAKRGKQLYDAGGVEIESVSNTVARVLVPGDRLSPYRVTIWVAESFANPTTYVSCDCPDVQRSYWIVCAHKVAATLALQDYLREHPPQVWKSLLSELTKNPARAGSVSQRQLLFFSLLKHYGGEWKFFPYTLPTKDFSAEALATPAALTAEIRRRHFSLDARRVTSRLEPDKYLNLTPDARAALRLLTGQNANMYYYGVPAGTLAPVVPLLAGCGLFVGTERDPLREPLTIIPDKAPLALELTRTAEGVQCTAQVEVDGQASAFGTQRVEVVAQHPYWLLSQAKLFQVQAPEDLVDFFLETPTLLIPEDDTEEFFDRYLVPLLQRVPVRGELVTWEKVEAEPVRRLYLTEVNNELHAHLRFGYGEHELAFDPQLSDLGITRLADSTTLVRIRRQPEVEQEAWQALSGYGLKRGTEPGQFILRKRTHPADFLLHELPKLTALGFEIYGEEALTLARVNRHKPTLSMRVSSGIDWFDVQTVINYGEIEVSLKEFRRALRKRERFIKLADGTIGEIPPEWLERYKHLFGLGEDTANGIRFSTQQVTLLDQLLATADDAQADEEFERRRQRLRDFTGIAEHPLPANFTGELRPYQKAGFDWLHFLHEYDFGGCLADDMGLGKTVQTLVFLQSLRESGHATTADLIVMPRSLLFNWEREASRFTPNLRVHINADQHRIKDPAEFAEYDLVLTTYGVMIRDIEMLRQYPFHYVILDESQAMKNPASQTARSARLLPGDHRLVLTGTPVENTTSELWSQFAYLNPGLLGSLEYFREEFVNPIERRQDDEVAQFLRKLVYPFILRRTKDQVAPELPPRTERLIYTEMEQPQRKLYNRYRDLYRAQLLGLIEQEGMNGARMKILEGLLRLRQLCNHPHLVEQAYKGESAKFDLLLDTLETLCAEGHKALVYSQFTSMLKLVREQLDARGVPYVYLDGQTRDRQERVDQFQNTPEIPLFLISLKAGGVGLNLTAADYVIHIDPWWNPAVEMQATDRTHRIGQDKPVIVYKLIVKDSVEEKILQLQHRKQALVKSLISTEGSFLKALTAQDVQALFS